MIENLARAPSKREIASEKRRNHILEAAIACFIEHLAVDAPANETLSAFLQDYWAIVSDKDVAILTAEITAEAMRTPDIAELFLEARRSLALVSRWCPAVHERQLSRWIRNMNPLKLICATKPSFRENTLCADLGQSVMLSVQALVVCRYAGVANNHAA